MPWAVELVAEVDSTNRVLLERARHGAAGGTVLVADHQTAGRGRLGRSWEAPPGSSLLVSVLLRPPTPVTDVGLVTVAAALAAADACEDTAGVRPMLKWPNDLVIGDLKLAGILAQSIVQAGRIEAVVVGMGLNLRWPEPMPAHLRESATTLERHARCSVDRTALLERWLDCLAVVLRVDRPGLLAAYRDRCATLGRTVRVVLPDREVVGKAVDVDAAGRLVVEGAAREVFAVGDVVHLRH